MKKEVKLLKKLEQLLKQLNCRSYLHHFGPKKFKLKHHLFALITMEAFQLSLRRVAKLLKMFGVKCPTYSALCKRRKKIPTAIWFGIMNLTAGLQHKIVAIDATGFSRTNPSHHYLRRIYRGEYKKGFAKLSILYDVQRHKVITLHTRVKPVHEIKDAKLVIGKCCQMKYLLADKAYDAEWLHEYCFDRKIKTIIPKKVNIRKGFYRRKQMKNFSEEFYHKRSNIESGFSAIKRKYGGSVLGKTLQSVNSELSCKAIAHNLNLFTDRFSTEPIRTILSFFLLPSSFQL